MLSRTINQFSGKRVVLLQGPVGPFFARLAKDLRAAGAEVFKVNFNAGDCFFYPFSAISYQGTMDNWPAWLADFCARLRIDVLLLFGDCRPIHRAAHNVAVKLGLDIGVFEEGYLRPDFITLERFGVNAYSQLSEAFDFLHSSTVSEPVTRTVGNAYWAMVWFSFWYFLIGALGKPWFKNYRHHRPLEIEILPWIRSVRRKQWYRWKERNIQTALTTEWSQCYFLVPLQVFNDSQITEHSNFSGLEKFIENVLHSFVRNAPLDTLLVFKHHPMDRGYRDYSLLIEQLVKDADMALRVFYIHDQHLPSLLDHARGVVLVNSTVGLSALHHKAPTKVCGRALYDLAGLTYQGSLDNFWTAAPNARPDPVLYKSFRQHLICKTQLNGSFYKPLKVPCSHTGLLWPIQSQDIARELSPISK